MNTHFPAGTETARAAGFLAGTATRDFAAGLAAALGDAFDEDFDNGLRAAGAFFAEDFAAAGLGRDRETDFDEALAMVSVTVGRGEAAAYNTL